MARKTANHYRITNENGYLIIRKEGAKLTKQQKEFMAQHGFMWDMDHTASHKIDANVRQDAWVVGLHFNASCEESVLDMFRGH